MSTKIKGFATWLGKVLIAGCLAFLTLTVFCLAYYNIPYHYPCDTGATDHKWKPKYFYARATEGFAFGQINNDGYNNSFDYTAGMNINVLVMGSSHMEGFNVMPNENAASILNNELKDKTVYNIGISAHGFLACCKNLDAALTAYHPSEYVVIETPSIDWSEADLFKFNQGEYPELNKQTDGFLTKISRNQYLRLLYSQLQSYLQHNQTKPAVVADEREADDASAAGDVQASHEGASVATDQSAYDQELDQLLTTLSETAKAHQTKAIILYHPSTGLHEDGSLGLPDDDANRAKFSKLCQDKGIIFLDMTERFKHDYEQYHLLPHGFSNTAVGSGHINKYGHRMIADELKKIIGE